MQVKVPYITIEQLGEVLATLVSSSVITAEQSAIIAGEAEIVRQTMIRKSTETRQANELRQKCYGLAKKEACATRRDIANMMRDDADALGLELADERSHTEGRIARIRQQRDIDLLRLQLDIDVLHRDRLSMSVGSATYCENIERHHTLQHRRAEVKAKAEADIENARAEGRLARKNIHAAYAESQADLRRRMEAATEAYELTRSIIESAADADLPGIFDELQGKKGGAA